LIGWTDLERGGLVDLKLISDLTWKSITKKRYRWDFVGAPGGIANVFRDAMNQGFFEVGMVGEPADTVMGVDLGVPYGQRVVDEFMEQRRRQAANDTFRQHYMGEWVHVGTNNTTARPNVDPIRHPWHNENLARAYVPPTHYTGPIGQNIRGIAMDTMMVDDFADWNINTGGITGGLGANLMI
jgi:hypothetical protein